MGTMNRSVSIDRLAVAMLLASEATNNVQVGTHMLSAMRNHYRTINGGNSRKSNAAAAKRAKTKRRNIRARQSKRA